MINNKRVYAVATIRRDSKRLWEKNFAYIGVTPLCLYVLRECAKSLYIDDVYISTSDTEYQKTLSDCGYKIVNRPKELDADDVTTLPILQSAALNTEASDDDYIVWVDVTKPLTKVTQIDAVIEEAALHDYDSVFTVKEFNGYLLDDPAIISQNLQKRYIMWGAVRLRTKGCLLSVDPKTWGRGIKHKDLPICKSYEIDINNITDLICADALIQQGY